jgi:hypothetical protein
MTRFRDSRDSIVKKEKEFVKRLPDSQNSIVKKERVRREEIKVSCERLLDS